MLINQYNKQHFTGKFETGKNLENKLNNVKELNRLADVSKVEKIRTYFKDDSKYLPRENSFVTLVSKKVGDRTVHGTDCFLLSKNADKETISKRVYESAEQSIGKMYGNIAKEFPKASESTKQSQSKMSKFLTKVLNWFKK